MSRLSEFIQSNKEPLYSFATQNTPRNENGQAVILKDDEWRDQDEWESYLEEK